MIEFVEEGFEENEKYGILSEKIRIDHSNSPSVITPLFTLETVQHMRVAIKGQIVIYLDKNGYDYERKLAEKKGFLKGNRYTVETVKIDDFSSYYTLKGIEGDWNTAMFERE